jgi:phage terminase large subunit-like protein
MKNLPTSYTSLDSSTRLALEQALETETERRLSRTKLFRFKPVPKQMEFYANGAKHRERLLMAANQVGKTTAGAVEAAFHLTGRYPDWWPGRKWDLPVRAWAGSVTSEVTRDGAQRLLVGEPKDESAWGTGMIPGDDLVDWSRRAHGVPDALDSVMVRHVSGGYSTLGFKSYDQGREKWQAETLDFLWLDEECPMDIYTEGLTRTNATDGMVYMTFTPLRGLSDVVYSFLYDEAKGLSVRLS